MSTAPDHRPDSQLASSAGTETQPEMSDERVVEESPPSSVPLAERRWFLPTAVGVGSLILGIAVGVGVGVPVGTAVHAAADRAEADAARSAADAAAEEAARDRKTFFDDAAERCRIRSLVEIADDGGTLIVDGQGEEPLTGDVTFRGLECIIDEVGAPRAVKQAMFETRIIDGRQSDSWEESGIPVEASWSCHFDDGLDTIFELVE